MSENGRLTPSELAPIAGGELATAAAAAWNALNVESRKRGLELLPVAPDCSYRNFDRQQFYWNLFQSGKGNLAAHPGTSNHGLGHAVDVATHEMRSMIDTIGVSFGWSKTWSDAPSEWWHIVYQAGHYSGSDPGPKGTGSVPAGHAPPFPFPPDQFLGAQSADPKCHTGLDGGPSMVAVRTWQERMSERGWTIGVDGKFASESEKVAEKFQSQVGLTVDGKVGPQTWSAAWTAPVT